MADFTANIRQKTPIPTNRPNLAISNHCDDTVLDGWLHMVREICDSADASVEVLNDLLNYDKIQMGSFSMEFTLLSIWQLVEETSRDFKLSARRKGVQFILDKQLSPGQLDLATVETGDLGAFKFVGDRIRLIQILRNLASNALKVRAYFASCISQWFCGGIDCSRRSCDLTLCAFSISNAAVHADRRYEYGPADASCFTRCPVNNSTSTCLSIAQVN